MSRLFTFGCSYTNYPWKTWADILGEEYDEFTNYGKMNGGNDQIFFKIIKAHKEHKFTKEDTVAVCWTHALRKDEYKINKWVHKERPPVEDMGWKSWFKAGINVDEQWHKTLCYISAANILLSTISKYICFSVVDYGLGNDELLTMPWSNTNTDQVFAKEINQFADKNFDSVLGIAHDQECKHRISLDIRPQDPSGGLDDHPTPKEHLHFLENIMKISISESTKQKVEQWETAIKPIQKNEYGA